MSKIHEDVPILISLKKLINQNISADEYIVLYLLNISENWKLKQYLEIIDVDIAEITKSLIERKFLRKINDNDSVETGNLEVTNVLKNFLKKKSNDEDVEEWITEWYGLWPSGIKSGGYYLKTDKKGSLRKMKKFLVFNPEYDKEIIMKATKNYLLEQSIKGYAYTKLAPYFIDKDGLSILAGECEVLENNIELVNNGHQNYGEDEI